MDEITTTISSIRAASVLLESLITTNDGRTPYEKIRELQNLLLTAERSAESAQLALAQSLDDIIKGEAAKIQSWNSEKERYSLKEVSPGVFIYVVKEKDKIPGEPDHFICPGCYQRGCKSILQLSGKTKSGFKHFKCHLCDTVIEIRDLWTSRSFKGP